jgi:hypothetical protein
MSEWWTYTLSDFLLFSPRVYYRLLELHNVAVWPAHILTVLSGLAVLYLLLSPGRSRDRFVFLALGAIWLWVAWSFLWHRYASINWAAAYVAPFYALEGLLIILIGAAKGTLPFPTDRKIPFLSGLALLAFSLVGYPLIARGFGRPWLAAEVFGIAPDPTATATLAILALSRSRWRWLLMILPLLWCMIGGATLWAMDAADFFVAPLAALAAVGLSLIGTGGDDAQLRQTHGGNIGTGPTPPVRTHVLGGLRSNDRQPWRRHIGAASSGE